MSAALQSTGRAVFLSAMTTIIGFISLTFAPMKPIRLLMVTAGIVVVYILTMIMVPNLTILLDSKPHIPPKVFAAAVNMPVKWSGITLLFIALMVISAGYNRQNVRRTSTS